MKKTKFFKVVWILMVSISFVSCSNDNDSMVIEPPMESTPPKDDDAPPINSDAVGLTLILEQNFGSTSGDFGNGVVSTPDGGFIFSGIQSDENAFLMATNSELNISWEKEVGVSGIGSLENIVASEDGNFIAAGFTQTDISGFDFDLYVIKIDAMGNIIWEQTYGVGSILDTSIDLIETSDGNIVLVGSIQPDLSEDGAGINDISVTMINEDGVLIWNNTYGGSASDVAISLIEGNDGNFLVVGTTTSADGDVSSNKGDGDVWILQIDDIGQLLNQKTFGSSGRNGGTSITALQNGNYIVTASNNNIVDGDLTSNNGSDDLWIFTIDGSLNLLNQASFGGSGSEGFRSAILEAPNGNIFLTTSSNSSDADVVENKGGDDFWILKLSSSLEILDQVSIGGSNSDFASKMVLLNADKFLVVGSSASSDGDIGENNGSFGIWAVIVEDLP